MNRLLPFPVKPLPPFECLIMGRLCVRARQAPGGAGDYPLGRIQACAEQARPRPSLILAVHANESRPPASALGLSTGEKDTVPGMPAGEVFSFVSRVRGPGTGELVFEGNDGPKFIAAQKVSDVTSGRTVGG